jgi:hypothetical protein
MTKKWRKIVSADDDTVCDELIEWAGLSDLWTRFELDSFDFLQDYAELCDHIVIERKEWDHDFPGLSGIWHIIKTDNPKELKKELRTQAARMLWEKRRLMREEMKRQKREAEERRRARRIRTRKHKNKGK